MLFVLGQMQFDFFQENATDLLCLFLFSVDGFLFYIRDQ